MYIRNTEPKVAAKRILETIKEKKKDNISNKNHLKF